MYSKLNHQILIVFIIDWNVCSIWLFLLWINCENNSCIIYNNSCIFLILILWTCTLYIPTTIKHKIFWQINCFRLANILNDATIINIFNSDNSNITRTKAQPYDIMTTITDRILKVKTMIEKLIITNNTSFIIITFSKISSFILSSFYRNAIIVRTIY